MKKSNWLIWILFTAGAMGLRAWQMLAGFESSGLAKHGFVPGLLLPAVLLAAALLFALRARTLPARRDDVLRLRREFRFADNLPAVLCVVTGSFLVMLSGGLFAVSAAGSVTRLLLALFAAASGACALYVVFALYRGSEAQGIALLVPICALIDFLVYLYRADASDPVLARTYIEILAVAALTLSTTQRAAFVFGGSAPRRYVPVSAVAALLALTAAVEGGGLSRLALLVGCAAVELGFLAAADFEASAAVPPSA